MKEKYKCKEYKEELKNNVTNMNNYIEVTDLIVNSSLKIYNSEYKIAGLKNNLNDVFLINKNNSNALACSHGYIYEKDNYIKKTNNIIFTPILWGEFIIFANIDEYDNLSYIYKNRRTTNNIEEAIIFNLNTLKYNHGRYIVKESIIKYKDIQFIKNLDLLVPIKSDYNLVITKSIINNYIVHIDGIVKDRNRPGFPVRLAFYVNNNLKKFILARKSIESNNEFDGSNFFSCEFIINEDEIDSNIKILIENDVSNNVFYLLKYRKNNLYCITQYNEKQPKDSLKNINGKIEHIDEQYITGWAYSEEEPESTLVLKLFFDNCIFASTITGKERKDVKKKYRKGLYSGFVFELPENLLLERFSELKITHGNEIIDKIYTLKNNKLFYISNNKNYFTYKLNKTNDEKYYISVIIINKNGSKLLKNFFESVIIVEEKNNIEWIVIDHNSQDDSEQVCNSYSDKNIDIRFIKRNANYSFSESNNYGAKIAKGNLLIFANNDLIFKEKFSEKIKEAFQDGTVGIAGVKLVDFINSNINNSSFWPIQHIGCFIKHTIQKEYIRPYESRNAYGIDSNNIISVPFVTGAFLAIRKEDFIKIDGFNEKYIYGLEDIDLCLKNNSILNKKTISINNIAIIHHRGWTRKKEIYDIIRKNNNDIFNATWSKYIREKIYKSILKASPFWIGHQPIIAFAVSDAGNNTSAGEYYTALEFSRALQQIMPFHIKFITKNKWYNLKNIDVIINMVKPYNIKQIYNTSPFLIKIAWIRQWFDLWCEDENIYSYDYIFTSSEIAQKYIFDKTGISAHLLRIASNEDVFLKGKYNNKYKCDYCFTGSFFNTKREIQFCLNPQKINGEGKVFGYNWNNTNFANLNCGPVPYSEMKDVYASSKITIDDANIATKLWGSCNSRVFDSILAGSLLITNGKKGVNEIFGDLIPVYNNEDSLTKTINYWIQNDKERNILVKKLRNIILKKHTYKIRAREFSEALSEDNIKLRISIKCPALESEKIHWGDYHFAKSLAKELRKLGCIVRIDTRDYWYSPIAQTDDIVIVLRGLIKYETKKHQINIIWILSHPFLVTMEELSSYNILFCASEYHTTILMKTLKRDVIFLPQCTDADSFNFNKEIINTKKRNIFVGNSRGVFRESAKICIKNNLKLDVYGRGWQQFIQQSMIKGEYIPNEILPAFYASSRYVLCDHWHDMRELGYVSNRIFDVIACGGVIISDQVVGIENIFNFDINIYKNEKDLINFLKNDPNIDIETRQKYSQFVVKNHSFAKRAKFIITTIKNTIH